MYTLTTMLGPGTFFLVLLLDEILGPRNFINSITWKRSDA